MNRDFFYEQNDFEQCKVYKNIVHGVRSKSVLDESHTLRRSPGIIDRKDPRLFER